jgi:hypothetical protein
MRSTQRSTVLSVAHAREHFGEITNQVIYAKERIVLSKHKKAVLAIVPIEDLEYLEMLEFQHDIREAEKAIKEHEASGAKTLPLLDILRKKDSNNVIQYYGDRKRRKTTQQASKPTQPKTKGTSVQKTTPAQRKPASGSTTKKKTKRKQPTKTS